MQMTTHQPVFALARLARAWRAFPIGQQLLRADAAAKITIALLALLWVTPARADITPPDGYVERCTMANAIDDGEECVEHGHVAWDERCLSYLEQQGFCLRCGLGATQRVDILCRKRGAPPLPADWQRSCPGPDPQSMKREDRIVSGISRCPTDRTTSKWPDEGPTEANDQGANDKKPASCGCTLPGAAGDGVAPALACALLALLRAARAHRA